MLVKKVRVERTRRFGDCYLGLELWKRLQLDDFFAGHMDGDYADVPWSRVAAVLAINLRASLWSLLLPSYSQKILSRTAVGLYRQSAFLADRQVPQNEPSTLIST